MNFFYRITELRTEISKIDENFEEESKEILKKESENS